MDGRLWSVNSGAFHERCPRLVLRRNAPGGTYFYGGCAAPRDLRDWARPNQRGRSTISRLFGL